MYRVTRVDPFDGYRLLVVCADGVQREVDLSNRVFGPVFEPVKDLEFLSQASIDEFGVILGPDGADLAPDTLHEALCGRHANGSK